MSDPWEQDLLGFRSYGETFTTLVRSIDAGSEEGAKVISIEAGFGRGKTFFREGWARQLEALGEVVVVIDAQQSDHSGDPVVTFLGALVGAVPAKEVTRRDKALAAGRKIGGLVVRTGLRAVLRSGAEELIEAATGAAAAQVDGVAGLEAVVASVGEGMSKLAGELIAAQLAAEQVRARELPAQIAALRDALTEGKAEERVVILIDELDRCHPDYALALLEAMKLVFNQPGFVFCLLVNAEYLERLAEHRFGAVTEGERYLDKFVDLRLRLPMTDEALAQAVHTLALRLPEGTPLGEDREFSIERAAELARDLAVPSKLSLRQIKRVLMRVEIALRCYPTEPLDYALLVLLAFRGMSGKPIGAELLKRSQVVPRVRERFFPPTQGASIWEQEERAHKASQFVQTTCPELLTLPQDRYHLPDGENYHDWAKVVTYLAEVYLPRHRQVLDMVHRLEGG